MIKPSLLCKVRSGKNMAIRPKREGWHIMPEIHYHGGLSWTTEIPPLETEKIKMRRLNTDTGNYTNYIVEDLNRADEDEKILLEACRPKSCTWCTFKFQRHLTNRCPEQYEGMKKKYDVIDDEENNISL